LTESFDEVHSPSIVSKALSAEKCVGLIDPTSVAANANTINQKSRALLAPVKPELHSLISVHDFEDVAGQFFSAKAFAFFSSAATDLVSYQANMRCHRQLLLRPRVLRNVKNVSLKRTILGQGSSAPFFVSPAAMARLAHPDGELAIARACGEQGIIQTVSSNSAMFVYTV
jgi:L-lactate dehydrogenase (cytochrome)